MLTYYKEEEKPKESESKDQKGQKPAPPPELEIPLAEALKTIKEVAAKNPR